MEYSRNKETNRAGTKGDMKPFGIRLQNLGSDVRKS